MMDPNFKRSVILLTEYSEAGAMGFILNHASEFLLGDIMPDLSYSEIPVFIGGPVAGNTLHFIHRCPEKIEDGIEIAEGIFWGGDFETVRELITSYQLNADEIIQSLQMEQTQLSRFIKEQERVTRNANHSTVIKRKEQLKDLEDRIIERKNTLRQIWIEAMSSDSAWQCLGSRNSPSTRVPESTSYDSDIARSEISKTFLLSSKI